MIYTSYFGRLKKVNKLMDGKIYIPYSIAFSTPNWFHGPRIKSLMPDYDLLTSYKNGIVDKARYTTRYQNKVLKDLVAAEVILELESFLPDTVDRKLLEMDCSIMDTDEINILLCCYEKPEEFCHRHILAKWLNDNGYEVKEFEL